MRVLIATPLYPPEIGGPATYSKMLEDSLPKHNLEVDLLKFTSVKNFPKVIKHFIYFLKVLRNGGKADVILALDPFSVGLPAALANIFLRKKFIMRVAGDYAWEQGVQRFGVKEVLDDFLKKEYGFQVEFFRKVEKYVAFRADKIIVPSRYLKRVVANWGIPENKILVIYNAFDGSPTSITLGKQEARQKLGLFGKILVSAGRDVPWKGFKSLRELMHELNKKFPDAKLVILNEVSREKVLEHLRAADVFVLNTAYEGFSHQILEAMAMGAPVVTTDVGGNAELIQNGESGFLVKYNDQKALLEKISILLSDPVLAQKFGAAAQKKAHEFTHEQMIKETLSILAQ